VKNYPEYADKEDFKVFFVYVSANRKYEEDKAFASRVQEHIQKAESGDSSALDSITEVAGRCLKGQKQIYDLLDIKFDYFDYESTYIKTGSSKSNIRRIKKPTCKAIRQGIWNRPLRIRP